MTDLTQIASDILDTQDVMEAVEILKAYGNQRYVEGMKAAVKEIEPRSDPKDWNVYEAETFMNAQKIRALIPKTGETK